MKAITLWQPWASLIVTGAKRIETRSWGTKYRGEIAIHAAQTWNRQLRAVCYTEPFYTALAGVGDPKQAMDYRLPLGAVVAVARLVECKPTGSITEQLAMNGHVLTDELTYFYPGTEEIACGDFKPGRFGWLLANVQVLPEPIPAKGMQGLWEWDEAGFLKPEAR